MDNLSGPGRPTIDAGGEKKTARYTMRIKPSRKKILAQEARRCGSSVNKLIGTIGMEAIQPAGRRYPVPNVFDRLLKAAGDLTEVAEETSGPFFAAELQNLESELRLEKSGIQDNRKRREKLREQAESETREEFQSAALRPTDEAQLEEKAEAMDVSPGGLLREKTLSGLREHEMMQETEAWTEDWAASVGDLSETSGAESGSPEAREKAQAIASRIRHTIDREIYGGSME